MSHTLQHLKDLFRNRPDVMKMLDLRELDLSNLTDQQLIKEQQQRKLYPEPVNFYATGCTGAGKSSLGNRLVGMPILESHGHQDCTNRVQYFQLASNLRYYDLPGAGSEEEFENINRAALLVPQLDDPDEEMFPVNELEIYDYSNDSKGKPVLVNGQKPSVAHWQSPENQENVAPDIILYVVAPQRLFVRADRTYLRALLHSQKKRSPDSKVIFALNIFRTSDGTVTPTSQNIEDAKEKIKEIYQKYYSGEPPIVEIDALEGTGIHRITELMCQILPSNKIGNMQQVLRGELKQYALAERSRRYRQALIHIAARLATYVVDMPLGNKGILQEAYAAVCNYGIRIFREEEKLVKAEEQLYQLVSDVATQAKISREKTLTVKEQITEERPQKQVIITHVPQYEDREYTETQIRYENRTKYREVRHTSGEDVAAGAIAGAAAMAVLFPVSIPFLLAGAAAGGMAGTNRSTKRVPETVRVPVEQMVTKVGREFVGMKEEREEVVVGTYQVVVGEREKAVGKKAQQGGYVVVEDLLAIGLGLETAESSLDLRKSFDAVVRNGRKQVQPMLIRYKNKINQLAESSDDPEQAETGIIQILNRAFIPT